MFAPVVALIAHLLIAFGSPAFTVAYPDETFEQAEVARTCADWLTGVVCTDGDTFGG